MLDDRALSVLGNLSPRAWLRPLDLGGHSRSHHSRTLARLRELGLAERRQRRAYNMMRPSYVYRLTEEGYEAVKATA